jgi:HPr kinase/phosphorylase
MRLEPYLGRVSVRTLVQACPYPLRPLVDVDPETIVEIESYMHRPGLLLAGFRPTDEVERHVLVFGREEFLFLRRQTPETQQAWLRLMWSCRPPLVIVGSDAEMTDAFLDGAVEYGVPVYASTSSSRAILAGGFRWLERLIVPWFRIPGNLVEIFGLGVLITGESGIGKSECTLDLLGRGHRLVADDAIEVACFQDGTLIGRAPRASYGLLEIRGLGILDVRFLFGVLAVLEEKTIDLVVQLVSAHTLGDIDRLGTEVEFYTLPHDLGSVPMIRLPVVPGRNLAALIETAVRWYMLRQRGFQVGQRLIDYCDRMARGEPSGEDPP